MKKLLLSLLTIPIFLLLTAGVFAQQRTDNQNTTTTLPQNRTVNETYFAADDTVIVSGTVNSDAYVAGGNVIIEGTINGDLIVAGGNVTISGPVRNDLRAAGGNIIISAPIGGSMTLLAGSATITNDAAIENSLVLGAGNVDVRAPVGGGIYGGVGQLTVASPVDGNIRVGVGQLTLTDNANITGNIEYWSESKIQQASGASVSGQLTQRTPPKTETPDEAVGGILTGFSIGTSIAGFITTLVLGLLFIYFVPKYYDSASGMILKSLGKSLLTGFITIIVVPFLIFILFATLIGIPLGLLVLLMFILMFFFAKVLAVFAIGRKIAEWGKWDLQRGWVLLIGLIAYTVLGWIPIIGWFMVMLAYFAGFGAWVLAKRNYFELAKNKKII